MDLRQMAAQYRENATVYAKRLDELRHQLQYNRKLTPEERRRLQQKALMCETVIAEALGTAAHLEDFLNDGEEEG